MSESVDASCDGTRKFLWLAVIALQGVCELIFQGVFWTSEIILCIYRFGWARSLVAAVARWG